MAVTAREVATDWKVAEALAPPLALACNVTAPTAEGVTLVWAKPFASVETEHGGTPQLKRALPLFTLKVTTADLSGVPEASVSRTAKGTSAVLPEKTSPEGALMVCMTSVEVPP